jgi:hypothetical protein
MEKVERKERLRAAKKAGLPEPVLPSLWPEGAFEPPPPCVPVNRWHCGPWLTKHGFAVGMLMNATPPLPEQGWGGGVTTDQARAAAAWMQEHQRQHAEEAEAAAAESAEDVPPPSAAAFPTAVDTSSVCLWPTSWSERIVVDSVRASSKYVASDAEEAAGALPGFDVGDRIIVTDKQRSSQAAVAATPPDSSSGDGNDSSAAAAAGEVVLWEGYVERDPGRTGRFPSHCVTPHHPDDVRKLEEYAGDPAKQEKKLAEWRRSSNTSRPSRVDRALTALSKRSQSAAWEVGSAEKRSLGGAAAVAYRRRPSQSVQALSADLVALLAELRLSRHGAKLATLGVTSLERLRGTNATELSATMVSEHGMAEVERKRLLRAVSIAQAAAPAFTSSWVREATLRTY